MSIVFTCGKRKPNGRIQALDRTPLLALKRPKVQAQRKFAEGVPAPRSPEDFSSDLNGSSKRKSNQEPADFSNGDFLDNADLDLQEKEPTKTLAPPPDDFMHWLRFRGTALMRPDWEIFEDPSIYVDESSYGESPFSNDKSGPNRGLGSNSGVSTPRSNPAFRNERTSKVLSDVKRSLDWVLVRKGACRRSESHAKDVSRRGFVRLNSFHGSVGDASDLMRSIRLRGVLPMPGAARKTGSPVSHKLLRNRATMPLSARKRKVNAKKAAAAAVAASAAKLIAHRKLKAAKSIPKPVSSKTASSKSLKSKPASSKSLKSDLSPAFGLRSLPRILPGIWDESKSSKPAGNSSPRHEETRSTDLRRSPRVEIPNPSLQNWTSHSKSQLSRPSKVSSRTSSLKGATEKPKSFSSSDPKTKREVRMERRVQERKRRLETETSTKKVETSPKRSECITALRRLSKSAKPSLNEVKPAASPKEKKGDVKTKNGPKTISPESLAPDDRRRRLRWENLGFITISKSDSDSRDSRTGSTVKGADADESTPKPKRQSSISNHKRKPLENRAVSRLRGESHRTGGSGKKHDEILASKLKLLKSKRRGSIPRIGELGTHLRTKSGSCGDLRQRSPAGSSRSSPGSSRDSSKESRGIRRGGSSVSLHGSRSKKGSDSDNRMSPAPIKRPSRRSKEACSSYMELFLSRLSAPDDDMDELSLTEIGGDYSAFERVRSVAELPKESESKGRQVLRNELHGKGKSVSAVQGSKNKKSVSGKDLPNRKLSCGLSVSRKLACRKEKLVSNDATSCKEVTCAPKKDTCQVEKPAVKRLKKSPPGVVWVIDSSSDSESSGPSSPVAFYVRPPSWGKKVKSDAVVEKLRQGPAPFLTPIEVTKRDESEVERARKELIKSKQAKIFAVKKKPKELCQESKPRRNKEDDKKPASRKKAEVVMTDKTETRKDVYDFPASTPTKKEPLLDVACGSKEPPIVPKGLKDSPKLKKPLSNSKVPVVSISPLKNIGSLPVKRPISKTNSKHDNSGKASVVGDKESSTSLKDSPSTKSSTPRPSTSKEKTEDSFQKPTLFVPSFPVFMQPVANRTVQVSDAPVYKPTSEEFGDPLEFIAKTASEAERFGMCRIIPPSDFKPDCSVHDDMRFMAYNQYIHKMYQRWNKASKTMAAIVKCLKKNNISMDHAPWIGGVEIDLVSLYDTVQEFGGLAQVMGPKKWARVADELCIPPATAGRADKLDEIYCKYVLPYDALSPVEKESLLKEIEEEFQTKSKARLAESQKPPSDAFEKESGDEDSDSDDESLECVVKGRNMPLSQYFRISRNLFHMKFKDRPAACSKPSSTKAPTVSVQEIESEYWDTVSGNRGYVCSLTGSIDSGVKGQYGFPSVNKPGPFSKHPWNLKVLTNNPGSLLRCIGPVIGMTIPTIHVGMIFSTCCWYRDPHCLPWIEYLHAGAPKIWYSIPPHAENQFKVAMLNLMPEYCHANNPLWLSSDTAMVPIEELAKHGVPVSRTVQEPGSFVVFSSKTFVSSVCTGYTVSESVYFAPPSWLPVCKEAFSILEQSKEEAMFSMERLLFNLAKDAKVSSTVLSHVLSLLEATYSAEEGIRKVLKTLGIPFVQLNNEPEILETNPNPSRNYSSKKKIPKVDAANEISQEQECDICSKRNFLSWAEVKEDDAIYCLNHALEFWKKNPQQPKSSSKLTVVVKKTKEEIRDVINQAKLRIMMLSQRKPEAIKLGKPGP